MTDVDETPTPSNNPPTDISINNNSIAENSNNGTVVGSQTTIDSENSNNRTVVGSQTTIDSDANDTHTYKLLNDADGGFVVDGNRILVVNSSLLDFENNTAHTINIRTTDSGTPPESFQQQLIINVTDVDETSVGNNNTVGTPGSDRLTGTNGGDVPMIFFSTVGQ